MTAASEGVLIGMFERFTDRARRVMVLAQEEARMLNHNYIGTEHILLGLIHEGTGIAAKALAGLPQLVGICGPDPGCCPWSKTREGV